MINADSKTRKLHCTYLQEEVQPIMLKLRELWSKQVYSQKVRDVLGD